jgi:quinol monooxygenase YgiN
MASKIIVSGTLHVDPADRASFLAAREAIVAHARDARGCLDFSLSPDLLDAGRVNVYEAWRTDDDLRAYRAGPGPWQEDSIPLLAASVQLHRIASSGAP